MIGEFLHFYPAYTVESVLNMYAVTFFALLATLYRIKGINAQEQAYNAFVAHVGGDSLTSYIESTSKQAKGARGLLEEVQFVRSLKK